MNLQVSLSVKMPQANSYKMEHRVPVKMPIPANCSAGSSVIQTTSSLEGNRAEKGLIRSADQLLAGGNKPHS